MDEEECLLLSLSEFLTQNVTVLIVENVLHSRHSKVGATSKIIEKVYAMVQWTKTYKANEDISFQEEYLEK